MGPLQAGAKGTAIKLWQLWQLQCDGRSSPAWKAASAGPGGGRLDRSPNHRPEQNGTARRAADLQQRRARVGKIADDEGQHLLPWLPLCEERRLAAATGPCISLSHRRPSAGAAHYEAVQAMPAASLRLAHAARRALTRGGGTLRRVGQSGLAATQRRLQAHRAVGKAGGEEGLQQAGPPEAVVNGGAMPPSAHILLASAAPLRPCGSLQGDGANSAPKGC